MTFKKTLALFSVLISLPAFAVECTQLDAADPTVPNVFTSGQPAVAADVNANFDCLADELGSIQKAIKADASGNVGIGTATPAATLHVEGTLQVGSTVGAARIGEMTMLTGSTINSPSGETTIALPSGFDENNTLVLAAQIKHSSSEVYPIQYAPGSEQTGWRITLSGSIILSHNQSWGQNQPYFILIAKRL